MSSRARRATRCSIAESSASPWPEASREEVTAFLERWRFSRWALLQQGYQALHDLVLAAWYARPDSWPAIGYAGPPEVK